MEWTARAYGPPLVIPAGTAVEVMEISGGTALVYPQEGPHLPTKVTPPGTIRARSGRC
jgi:hypothetical protein